MAPPRHRRSGLWTLALAAGLGGIAWAGSGAPPLDAQVIEGRVTDENGVSVEGALVGLYDVDGAQRAATISNAQGFYRLEAPEPGEYVLGAERIGFTPLRSHLLGVGAQAEPYRIDLELEWAPVPIEGVTVTADRGEAFNRRIRLAAGVHPNSLRNRPMLRDSIIAHWEWGRNLPEMLRWSNVAGLTVLTANEGYCFYMRARCVPVIFNGMPMAAAWHDVIPIELLETVVVIGRNETIQYPDGAILLYTEGWLR